MTKKPSIQPKANGSLVVSGPVKFVAPDGTETSSDDNLFLCRCGQSGNKPYCDGSHRDAGFSSENDAGPPRGDRIFAYEGAEITVQYNKLLCSHAAECGKRLKAVFDPSAKPWVQPDNGSVDEIKDVIAACPSGALSYRDHGQTTHIVGDAAKVAVEPNGPYRVENVDLSGNGHHGEGSTPDKYVLCRCGLSGNKPYCDGTHRDAKWRDSD